MIRATENPEIGYLADNPEFVATLARWHHQEWAYLRPGDTLEARTARLRSCCQRGRIPSVVVAFNDGVPLGSAMLVEHDMDTRMDLSPWLAGVFVVPEYRRRGVGTVLVRRIIEEAAGLGVDRLYLYTPSAERFYQRLCWSEVERTVYRGARVVVMTYP